MATAKKSIKIKAAKRNSKSSKAAKSKIITVRISDEEKDRIDDIMINMDIKRYSDVMRLALHMMKPKSGYI